MDKLLPDSFIMYLPKDVVAGDFYWLEKHDDWIIFAAADCTGHGVPGAMVSVICFNALNRSVREFGITDPGKILDKTRELVINQFQKSDDEVNDGMDISICSWNVKTNELLWAGANNPIWLVRKGELISTKGNKQPIGIFENLKPFDTHSFELIAGDCVYVFTDGYQDQFGGERNKKFKTAALSKLVLSLQKKSMADQHNELLRVFEVESIVLSVSQDLLA